MARWIEMAHLENHTIKLKIPQNEIICWTCAVWMSVWRCSINRQSQKDICDEQMGVREARIPYINCKRI